MRPITRIGIVASALLPTYGITQAQTVPDAGSLRQQIEHEREIQLPRRIDIPPPAQPATLSSIGQTITVTEFRFSGNTLLSNEKLVQIVASYRNRPLDFNQLQAAANAVAAAYREAGWTVRAYLPKQDVTSGVITIQIIEAVFGGARREGNDRLRFLPGHILAMLESAQPRGQILNTNTLDRALLLADDLPGVAVAGALAKGVKDGETELVVKMADKPLFMGDAALDNTSARSTGATRLAINTSLNGPFGYGELYTANLIHSQGSDYARLAASLPVGLDGWRIGGNASDSRYQLIAPEFKVLDARGGSSSIGMEANYPLIRSRLRNLYLGINHDAKRFDNHTAATLTSQYRVTTWSLALNGNLFDNLGGGGANRASLTWTKGILDLDGSPNQAADAKTTHTAGNFNKWRYLLSRQQVLTPELSLYAQWSGQLASKNLDSSERFYLGGAYGVRAYPANEGGGSEGQMANLELRWKITSSLVLTGFYDWGKITLNRDNQFTGAASLNDYSLKGHGLALDWGTPLGINLKAVWARRDGSNPNPTPTPTGRDQDGSLNKNRFWLTASLPF